MVAHVATLFLIQTTTQLKTAVVVGQSTITTTTLCC